jgi:hypothetical protein
MAKDKDGKPPQEWVAITDAFRRVVGYRSLKDGRSIGLPLSQQRLYLTPSELMPPGQEAAARGENGKGA